nr:hypothetical protein BgiMline_016730 [Biomphalaria glabrata]
MLTTSISKHWTMTSQLSACCLVGHLQDIKSSRHCETRKGSIGLKFIKFLEAPLPGSEPPRAGGPQSSIVAPTQEEDEDTEKEEDIMGIKEETAEGLDEILDMELQPTIPFTLGKQNARTLKKTNPLTAATVTSSDVDLAV